MAINIKKLVIGLLLASVIVSPALALAATGDDDDDMEIETAPTINVEEALGRITNYAFVIVLIVAVFFILLSGFWFITAGGDPDKLTKARMNLFYGVIGVIVALLAKGLVGLVRGVVGG
jgi:hypothetical protein